VVIPTCNKASFVDGGFAWVPLRSVREGEPCEVFNVSVDEDESYTAWGYAVHNCQDLSAAGKRAGIKEGTRSGLWSHFATAIDTIRPSYVVIENVRGILSAKAHREVEHEDPAVGEGNGAERPVLRALGAVCGDLSDIGYGARWTTLAASAVGAPHRRERVFILATPER
jgi:site-specific DNA-cytosine methylase